MPEALTGAGAIAAILLAFPLMWLVCFWVIAELGGWASLARSFATDREPAGDTFSWTSGKCNFFSTYNNCLIATVSDKGIDLRPMLLFRFKHRPLFFPWSGIAVMRPRPELFRYGTILEISTASGVHPVTLFGRRLAESLVKHAPDRLLGPRE